MFSLLNTIYCQQKIKISIQDDFLSDGKKVNVLLVNNTNFNYCFLMDTINFERDIPYYKNDFFNPKIILFDKKNHEIPIEMNIILHSKINYDSYLKTQKKYNLIIVKKKQKIILKVPFDIIVNYKHHKEPSFYELNKTMSYSGRIEYFVKENFIVNNLKNQKIDSLRKRGIIVFKGNLKSNKVPMVFDKL